MADARIEVTCPGCEKPFHVLPAEQGKIAECPHCQGWVDVPELSRPPTHAEVEEATSSRNAREYERQTAENARQLEEGARQQAESARQLVQAQRSLDKRDQQDARLDQLLDRMETVIGQWEQLASRMGRLIERSSGGQYSAEPPAAPGRGGQR